MNELECRLRRGAKRRPVLVVAQIRQTFQDDPCDRLEVVTSTCQDCEHHHVTALLVNTQRRSSIERSSMCGGDDLSELLKVRILLSQLEFS